MSRPAAQFISYGLVLAALLILIFSGTSLARWSDVERSPAGELRLGTIDVGLDDDLLLRGDQVTTTAPDSTPGTSISPPPPSTSAPVNIFSNVLPGDQVFASISVTNSARVPRRYSLRLGPTAVDFFQFVATEVVAGRCDQAAWGPVAAPVGNELILGDSALGHQAGDRVLAPGASEELCVRFSVDPLAGNTLQGVAVSREIIAVAEDAI